MNIREVFHVVFFIFVQPRSVDHNELLICLTKSHFVFFHFCCACYIAITLGDIHVIIDKVLNKGRFPLLNLTNHKYFRDQIKVFFKVQLRLFKNYIFFLAFRTLRFFYNHLLISINFVQLLLSYIFFFLFLRIIKRIYVFDWLHSWDVINNI